MRAGRPLLTAATLGLAFVVAACGSPGSSTGATTTPPDDEMTSPAGGGVCEAVAGDQLVVLEDDLGLQLSDNVVPAVNAAAAQASPGLVGVLDSVSAVLDTETLIQLNKQVDVDRRTSSEVAQTFLADQGLDDVEQVGDGVSITVGAPNFSEGATLAEVYAGALTAAGFAARTETIGNRETYLPALQQGDLQVVPEYAATLTENLNKTVNGDSAPTVATSDIEETMVELVALGEGVGLVFGEASAAQDQNAFAVTQAFAEEYGVSTLTELAETCGGGVTMGGPPECPERDFCALGLEQTYGLTITDFTSLDAGGPLTKAAIQQGQVAIGLVFSSDAALAG